MKRLVVLLALSGVAHADSVKPPGGWTVDQQAALSLAKQLGPLPHFGGLPSVVTTAVYRPAAGGSLFVTKLVTNPPPDQRDLAATAELVEIDASMKRGGGTGSGTRAAEPATKQLVGSRRWTDTSTGVVTDSRIVIAADGQQLVAVMGECVLAGDAPADVVTACRAALASLDPEIPLAVRVPLSIHGATVDSAAKPPPAPKGSASSGPSLVESGERPSLPPMQIPQDTREPDRRPIFVGIGLIVLALVFYWNRKNREKLERAYEKRTVEQPATDEAKPEKSDRDADDLHAAAEDDTKESK